jgi:hypothetical protein
VTRSAFLEGAREAGGTKTCKGEVAKQKTALSQGAASLSLAVVENEGRRRDTVSKRLCSHFRPARIIRKLSSDQMTTVQQSIIEVLRRSGTTNLGLANRLQETLTALGISSSKTQLVLREFIAVGEAVQGPDDSPLAN